MVHIRGSIDNASIGGDIHHLVFTNEEILDFTVMKSDERNIIMINDLDSTKSPFRQYNKTRRERNFKDVSDECLNRGKKIEQNIDSYFAEKPDGCASMSYTEITDFVLSGDSPFYLHSLSFRFKGSLIKYSLVFDGGKIPEELLNSYKQTFDAVFPDNWKIVKGTRARKLYYESLKTGAEWAIPVAIASFILSSFEHANLMSSILAAIIFYLLFFVLIGIAMSRFLFSKLINQFQ